MEIKLSSRYRKRLTSILVYAGVEFGQKTVRKWQESLEKMRKTLLVNPELYPFVSEIKDIQPNAHGVIMMKNFKVVFVFSPQKQIVELVDIWHMHQDINQIRKSWKIIRL